MRFVTTAALVASLALFGAAAAQEIEAPKAPPASLAEGAMAPSPAMTMTMPQQQQQPSAATPSTRRRSLLELEQLAQLAKSPSPPLVEQVPAASPAPLLYAPAPSVSLEEVQRQHVTTMSNIAPSVYEAISKNSQYSDLKQLVDKAGLAGALGTDFSGTLFAPTNQAFDNLAKGGGPTVSSLLSGSPSDLKKILLFHVASTRYSDADVSPGKAIYTKLPGASLQAVLSPSGKGVDIKPASYAGKKVGPAGPDVYAGKAAIFPIDAVLIPGPEDIRASV